MREISSVIRDPGEALARPLSSLSMTTPRPLSWDTERVSRVNEQTTGCAYDRALNLLDNPGIHRGIDVAGPVLAQARREIDALTLRAVAEARRRGERWSRIGPALGVSRQAAQKKYEHLTG